METCSDCAIGFLHDAGYCVQYSEIIISQIIMICKNPNVRNRTDPLIVQVRAIVNTDQCVAYMQVNHSQRVFGAA